MPKQHRQLYVWSYFCLWKYILKHVSLLALFLAVSAAIFLFFLHILLSMKSDK